MTAPDPTTLDALERAVAAAPRDGELRLHLARLLVEAGKAEAALAHITVLVAERPADVALLAEAEEAALACGESERAQSYRTMRDALNTGAKVPPQPLPAEGAMASTPEKADASLGRERAGADGGAEPLPLRVIDGDADSDLPAEVERPRMTLADVGGMEAVKHRLEMSFLAPMRNPQLRDMFRKSLRGGLLLWGPPGCGKTFIARATAGELGAKFVGVGLADVLDMWVGLSERNLHGVFELARRHAPCVLFIDELDALGQKRMNLRTNPSMRNVIAQLLTELDGAMTDNEGVFVLGATNAPWDIDPALKRPGRFDRTLLVLPPDRSAREAILRYHMRDRPLSGDIDLAATAARLDGLSGADVAQVCEAATEFALSDAITTGNVRPIDQADMDHAVKDTRGSLSEWFSAARNFAMFQNDGGVFDELLTYMRERRLN